MNENIIPAHESQIFLKQSILAGEFLFYKIPLKIYIFLFVLILIKVNPGKAFIDNLILHTIKGT